MKKITIGQHVVCWVAKKTNEFGNYGAAVGIGLEKDGEICAGVVFNDFNGASMCMHVASDGSRQWMNRELLRFVFEYAYRQAKITVLVGLVGEGNAPARRFIEHIGYTLEHRIKDGHPSGDMLIYTMREPQCRFIDLEKPYAKAA